MPILDTLLNWKYPQQNSKWQKINIYICIYIYIDIMWYNVFFCGKPNASCQLHVGLSYKHHPDRLNESNSMLWSCLVQNIFGYINPPRFRLKSQYFQQNPDFGWQFPTMFMYMYVYMYMYMCMYMCIYIYVCACMCIYIYTYVFKYIYICMYVYICIYIYIYMHIYIYICIYIYTCDYIQSDPRHIFI